MSAAAPYSCGKIQELKKVKGKVVANGAAARALLQKLADRVQPIMNLHKWSVGTLREFYPGNAGLLGMNENRGSRILIRLRSATSADSFLPWHELLGTLLHELVHNEISSHSAAFYKMLDRLYDELDDFERRGITGPQSLPFSGKGRRLTDSTGFVARDLKSRRSAALAAAERRASLNAILPQGGKRLGGSQRGSSSLTAAQLRRRSLAAAERRISDEISCGCNGKVQLESRKRSASSGVVSRATQSKNKRTRHIPKAEVVHIDGEGSNEADDPHDNPQVRADAALAREIEQHQRLEFSKRKEMEAADEKLARALYLSSNPPGS